MNDRPRHALLVDDDPHDVEMTLSAMHKNNLTHRVVVVRDGAEALDYLCREGSYRERPEGNPAVVMVDLKMPKVGGLAFLRRVKRDAAFRVIPVVVLTSSQEARDVEDCYDAGANAYVVKPIHFDEFLHVIGALGRFWMAVNEPPPAENGGAR